MGIERVKFSARMTEANAEFVAQLCERWSPVVEGVSATLNLIVAVVRRMERAGTIDLSLAGMQRLLCLPSGQRRQTDSVASARMNGEVAELDGLSSPSVATDAAFALPSLDSAETGRRDDALGVRAKRPPRHIRRFNHRAESAREVLGRPCVTSFLPRIAAGY